MTAKRGDRVAPPALPHEYEVRFAHNSAAKGWEELCSQAAGNTRLAFEAIRGCPRPFMLDGRHHRLKPPVAWATAGSAVLEQWQYEVTSGGRIWYLVDDEKRTAWITYASTRHPRETDRG